MMPDWSTVEGLRRWSLVLLWVSVLLPILTALAVGLRYYLEQKEKRLSGRVTANAIQEAQKTASAAQQDASAARGDAHDARQGQVTLRGQLVRSQAELADLRERTAPRRLSDQQRKDLGNSAASLRNSRIAVACRMMDGESCDYALDILMALRHAGATVPDLIRTSVNDFPGEVVVCGHGTTDEGAIRAVAGALRDSGLQVVARPVAENTVGIWLPNAVHVVVGRKAP